MTNAIQSSLSSLAVQSRRVALSADNIANAQSLGFRETQDAGDNGGFKPKKLVQSSLQGGGVTAKDVAVRPASVLVYEPESSEADAQGLVPRPNVSLEGEFITQLLAQRAYQASARVIKAEDERLRALNDIVA